MPATNLLKPTRLLHLYLGVFSAPALLFFSFTGAVQTFSLHETTRGSDYKPPQILVNLAQLHKKQTLVVPPPRPQSPPAAKPATPAEKLQGEQPQAARPQTEKPPSPPPGPKKNLLPMKIFFLTIAVSLFTSTLTGLYMSYKYVRNKLAITGTLLAGIAIPILLSFL